MLGRTEIRPEYLLHGLVVLTGLAALIWAISVTPYFLAETRFLSTADAIKNGTRFRPADIARLTQQLIENPKDLRAAAASKLPFLQIVSSGNAIGSGNPEEIRRELRLLASRIQIAIENNPSDPFLWLALYGLEERPPEISQNANAFLSMSYEYGPNEGWISDRRSPMAIAAFQNLPADLQNRALSEFDSMLRSELYKRAAEIALDAPGATSSIFLQREAQMSASQGKAFDEAILDLKRQRGDSSALPANTDRPWRSR